MFPSFIWHILCDASWEVMGEFASPFQSKIKEGFLSFFLANPTTKPPEFRSPLVPYVFFFLIIGTVVFSHVLRMDHHRCPAVLIPAQF